MQQATLAVKINREKMMRQSGGCNQNRTLLTSLFMISSEAAKCPFQCFGVVCL